MTQARLALGAYGERHAVEYLQAQGMRLLDRNWRCAGGEVDAILRDGDTLVFVEVKTRSDTTFGDPADAVNPAKVRRLRRLAAQWLAESGLRPREVRFDVVAVLRPPTGPAQIRHLPAAF